MTRPRISFVVINCTSELTIANTPIIAPPNRNNMTQLSGIDFESAKPAMNVPRQISIASAIRPLFRMFPIAATVSALARRATATLPAAEPYGDAARIAARARDLIHDAWREDVTADDLAAATGRTRYAVYRAFQAAYGMAPSDYQRQVRLRKARRLIARGRPLGEIAAETGFADQSHLTRWFGRYYGITPGGYRLAVRAEPDGG